MVALLLTTTISCSQAVKIASRLTNVIGLTTQQKIELIQTVQQSIPTCPLRVVSDERPELSN